MLSQRGIVAMVMVGNTVNGCGRFADLVVSQGWILPLLPTFSVTYCYLPEKGFTKVGQLYLYIFVDIYSYNRRWRTH